MMFAGEQRVGDGGEEVVLRRRGCVKKAECSWLSDLQIQELLRPTTCKSYSFKNRNGTYPGQERRKEAHHSLRYLYIIHIYNYNYYLYLSGLFIIIIIICQSFMHVD